MLPARSASSMKHSCVTSSAWTALPRVRLQVAYTIAECRHTISSNASASRVAAQSLTSCVSVKFILPRARFRFDSTDVLTCMATRHAEMYDQVLGVTRLMCMEKLQLFCAKLVTYCNNCTYMHKFLTIVSKGRCSRKTPRQQDSCGEEESTTHCVVMSYKTQNVAYFLVLRCSICYTLRAFK